MRITNRMLSDTVLGNLTDNLNRMETLAGQLTSGKRLRVPSDDPPAVGRALDFKASIAAGEQYLRTIDSSQAWLGATDTALDSMTQLLQRARELAVQGANDTLASDQQAAIANE